VALPPAVARMGRTPHTAAVTDFDTALPPVLAALHRLPFDYAEGEGIDFEPYDALLPPEENAMWIRAWTGDDGIDGAEYRVFGQDGTGGYAALWVVRPDAALSEQPVVFFGSEGELGVVARNVDDYLWLLAGGQGPYEAIAGYGRAPDDAFTAFAQQHAPQAAKSGAQVLADARAEFPDFEASVLRRAPADYGRADGEHDG